MNAADDVTILDRLMRIADLVNKDMAAGFAGTGLNQARAHLLWLLHHDGPSTQQALATALEVTPANVTGLVDALERHGFAQRRRHPTDRRATLVALTEHGTDTMRAMVRDRTGFAAALVQDFDAEQRRRLRDALDVVTERLEAITEPARRTKEER